MQKDCSSDLYSIDDSPAAFQITQLFSALFHLTVSLSPA